MKSHAKAASAGSSPGRGSRPSPLRRAFATRGAFAEAKGSSAPASPLHLALLTLCFLTLFLLPATEAAAKHYYEGSFGPDGSESTNFVAAGPIAVDQQSHDIYVADTGAGKLYKFDENHQPANFFALATNQIEGLAINGGGEGQVAVDSQSHVIYVTNGYGALAAFKANGEPSNFSAGPGAGTNAIGGFGELCGLATDANGAIYAGDYAGLKVFAPSGAPLTSPGPSGYCNLAVDANGALYYNQYAGGINWFTPTTFPVGGSTTYTPRGAVDTNGALSVAADSSNGDVYVAEHLPQSQIARFKGNGGAQLEILGATGPAALHGPTGVAVDGHRGRVYASDTAGAQPRVRVFSPAGKVPLATTTGSSEASFYLRTLEGSVDPEGFEVEECRFEYGTTAEYGKSKPCVPAAAELGEGSSAIAVSAQAAPLEPNTTYHFRLLASNSGGASEGEDLTFTTTSAPPDSCSNAAIRAQQGINAILLPDCMALEMVSPPQKENTGAEVPAISADGERVKFFSLAGLDGTEGVLSYAGDPYIASRGGSGWTTQATTPPAPLNRGWANTAEALSFSPNFTDWFQVATTERGAQHGEHTAYRHYLGGPFEAISPLMKPVGGSRLAFESEFVAPAGVSADHSHLFFTPGEGFGLHDTSWLVGDPAPTVSGSASALNLYLAKLDNAGEPSLQLAARDKNGKAWGGNCGASLGHFATSYAFRPNRGAISTDGTLAYLSTRPAQPAPPAACSNANKIRILKRTETQAGPEIEELFSSECSRVSPPCDTTDGDDNYRGASVDQTKVYFTTTRQLANSDLDTSADLYLYDSSEPAGERLTQVSAGGAGDPSPGQGAKVIENFYFPRISTDGSRVYFIAEGALTTTPNAVGDTAGAGEPNLYTWDRENGETAFIATLSSSEEPAYPVPLRGQDGVGNEVGGDGHLLLFQTKAELTANDADGSYRDDYRYDAETGALQCISCPPGGGGAFDLFGSSGQGEVGTDFAQNGRWASEDGEAVVFVTEEALLPNDEDGVTNFYLWRDGQLTRMPGVARIDSDFLGESPPIISADGSEVAFTTNSQLLPQDGDGAPDVYVARIDGGFPFPPPHVPCKDEACQEPFAPQPADQGAASDSFTGPGNVRETARNHHRKHRKKHHHKKKHSKSRRASHKQGGQK